MSLPPQWIEYKTGEGVPYYFNSTTGLTQWDKPTLGLPSPAPAPAAAPPVKPSHIPPSSSSAPPSVARHAGTAAPQGKSALPGRADLMSAIKGGAKLNKVDPSASAASAACNESKASIGGGGNNSRSKEGTTAGGGSGEGGGGPVSFQSSLQDALARRKNSITAQTSEGIPITKKEKGPAPRRTSAASPPPVPSSSFSSSSSSSAATTNTTNNHQQQQQKKSVEERLSNIEQKLELLLKHFNIKE